MIITFVDSSLLLAAFSDDLTAWRKVRQLLRDPNREFAASAFIFNETLPFTIFYRRSVRRQFLESYFDNLVSHWADDYAAMVKLGFEISAKYCVGMADALHVAAAHLLSADELVTLERPSSPLLQAQGYVKIVTYY